LSFSFVCLLFNHSILFTASWQVSETYEFIDRTTLFKDINMHFLIIVIIMIIIGRLHDSFIWLPLPTCFENFLSYSDLYSLMRIVRQSILMNYMYQKKIGKAFWYILVYLIVKSLLVSKLRLKADSGKLFIIIIITLLKDNNMPKPYSTIRWLRCLKTVKKKYAICIIYISLTDFQKPLQS
jgi:membrane protein CcdC involved in cytochrome C biogenesis